MITYAQNLEDVLLNRCFSGIQQGQYIDIGAAHPVEHSVSCHFYQLGWRGINVEPEDGLFRLLLEARPEDQNLNVVVADQAGTLPFYRIAETGLSTCRADLARAVAPRFGQAAVVEKPALTLDDILSMASGAPIHWLKIDAEGYEEKILRGWRKEIYPQVLVIESIDPVDQRPNHEAWDSLVKQRGYRLVWFDGLNRFYVHHQYSELADHFRTPPNIFDTFYFEEDSPVEMVALLRRKLLELREQNEQWRQDLHEQSAAWSKREEDLTHQVAALTAKQAELETALTKATSESQPAAAAQPAKVPAKGTVGIHKMLIGSLARLTQSVGQFMRRFTPGLYRLMVANDRFDQAYARFIRRATRKTQPPPPSNPRRISPEQEDRGPVWPLSLRESFRLDQ